MTEIQAKILSIFKWFHEFCVENGLTYYMLGGTQLGATRHKGFIPWDDDADVGMPRPDYERFLKITRGKTFGKYYVDSCKNEMSNYIWPFAKIFDKDTTFIERISYNIAIRGIWLDVFPLDGATSGIEKEVKFYKIELLKFIRNLRFAEKKKRAFWKSFIIWSARRFSVSLVNRMIDSTYSVRDFYASEEIGNFTCGYGRSEWQSKKIWGTPKSYDFEGEKFYGVERDEEYLQSIFGNYMELPPEEERIKHQAWFVDLNHGPDTSPQLKQFLKDSRIEKFLENR